jgi:uncharacterized protein (DUF58 family)
VAFGNAIYAFGTLLRIWLRGMNTKHLKGFAHRSERQLNVWLLPVFVVLLAILYGLTHYRGWLVFLIGTAGLWLLAFLWVYSLERGLSIERKIHLAWAIVGDSVPEQLMVINKSRFPTVWVEITDDTNMQVAPIRLVSDVGSQNTRRRHPIHLFKRRGLYTLGPTRLRTGDPFGIYSLTLHDQHSSTILVTPPQLPLTQLRIAPGGWAGDRQRRRSALVREISDAGVRNYVPGDSLRQIHWRASAHHDSLIVRQLEAATSEDWWIFVDLDATVQAGTGQDSTLELSVVLAASLVTRGIKEHRRVGLAMVGLELTWLEPRSDPAHRWRILRALAMAEAGNRSLADLMTLRQGRAAQTATLIVITPTNNPAWVATAGLPRRDNRMTALLINPGDFDSPLNQGKVINALARSGIPYASIPRSLLEEAYPSLRGGDQKPPVGFQTRKRYLQQGSASWQQMG